MAPDNFTERTSTSWISRLAGSIKSIFFGLFLFFGSMVLMWYNEGRAVKTAKALDEGSANVITIGSDAIDPLNNEKLIHVSGKITTSDILQDDQFGIQVNGLKFRRNVEMYQWFEKVTTSTKKKLGGGEETIKSYDYEKKWSPSVNESSRFKISVGHENPSNIPYASYTRISSGAELGKFKLTQAIINGLSTYTKYRVDSIPNNSDSLSIAYDGERSFIYNGDGSITDPYIGDIRISYDIILPNDYSLIAKQLDSTFDVFTASNGTNIQMIELGNHSAENMFESAKKGNTMLTWILRAVAILMMFFGLKTILNPLQVISDLIPIVNSIVGFGISLISSLITLALSFIVISLAWIFYRPVLGISLLLIAGVITFYLLRKRKNKEVPVDNV